MRFRFKPIQDKNKELQRILNKKHDLRLKINKTFTKYDKYSKILFKKDVLRLHGDIEENDIEEIEMIKKSTRIWQNTDEETDEGILKEQIWIGSNFSRKTLLISELKPLYNKLSELENEQFLLENLNKTSSFDIGEIGNNTVIYILNQDTKKDMFLG